MNFKTSILSTLMICTLLAFFSAKKETIPIGDASVYWEFACGVELEEFKGYFPFAKETGVFPKIDDWYFYYFREHHGRHVFKLKKESLESPAPELFSLLDTEITKTVQERSRHDSLEAKNERRTNCLNIREAVNSDQNKFISELNLFSKNKSKTNRLESFNRQWERAKL